jgi:hypothetical protein
VRELMLLIPAGDPGKSWQIGVTRGREEQWQLAANIVYYAADQRALRVKGETHLVADDPTVKTNASVKLARLKYKGNWDPEPGGWRRMRNILRNEDKLDADVETVELGSGSLDGFKFAHLTGTTKFKPDDAAKAQLKKFIAAGGTLLVDAAGGSEAFATAMEPELESLGTGAKLETLPPDHSLFGGGAGERMKIAYRAFAQKTLTGKANVPHVKAVRVGDRVGVLFSREDLTAGLLGTSVGGIVGYTPATATELVRRMVLKAAGVNAPPRPATNPAVATGGDGLDDEPAAAKPAKKPKKSAAAGTGTPASPTAPGTPDGSGLE